jgi:GNAT superfamily N-acetyltransferase
VVEERGIKMTITYSNIITVEDYNRLLQAVGWGTRNPEKIQMAIARSDFIVGAQFNGQTIGMARVMQDGLQALVMDVIVLPEYHGKRIGKTMMTKVMEYLNEISRNGGIKVNLISAFDRISFYEQFGFVHRTAENRGAGMSLWLENKEDTK